MSRVSQYAAAIAVLLTVAAMGLYPGGTLRDRSRRHYSFFGNSLSDLGSAVALNGEVNGRAAACFAASGIAFAVASALCLLRLPRVCHSRRSKQVIRAAVTFGFSACAGVAVAVVTPEDRRPMLHGLLSLLSIVSLAIATATVAVAGLLDEPPRRRASSAWFALSMVVVAWLAALLASPAILNPVVPITLQKALAAALVAVVFVQSREADARPGTRDAPGRSVS